MITASRLRLVHSVRQPVNRSAQQVVTLSTNDKSSRLGVFRKCGWVGVDAESLFPRRAVSHQAGSSSRTDLVYSGVGRTRRKRTPYIRRPTRKQTICLQLNEAFREWEGDGAGDADAQRSHRHALSNQIQVHHTPCSTIHI